ncbi:MAG: LysM peptidoglycan-binding domain-containing protein [Verrucomicrobiota bacterium]
MKSIFKQITGYGCGVLCAAALMTGCATGPKSMEPVSEKQVQQKSEFLKGLAIVEQPALEPEWADSVKELYPSWRRHYWVDRGQWGNRGYLVGKPTADSEPVVEGLQPLPPVNTTTLQPPAIIEQEPPKIEQADRPTKYVVKKGDSLWKIAGRVYHNPLKWPTIFRANKDKIKHPNRIYPGQVLTIPWN